MPQDVGPVNLSNGSYQKPSPNDDGNVWSDVIETVIERLAGHSHTGADSLPITANFDKEVQNLTDGVDFNWVSLGNDLFEAEFDLSAGTFYDTNQRQYFYIDGSGFPVRFLPTIIRVSNTRIKVQSLKNGFDLKVVSF